MDPFPHNNKPLDITIMTLNHSHHQDSPPPSVNENGMLQPPPVVDTVLRRGRDDGGHNQQQPQSFRFTRPNPYLPSNRPKNSIDPRAASAIRENMGLKSQHSASAIKACKKRGSSSWKNRSSAAASSSTSFECRICRAKALGNVKVPKRAHHFRCKFNRRNKQRQERAAATVVLPPPTGNVRHNSASLSWDSTTNLATTNSRLTQMVAGLTLANPPELEEDHNIEERGPTHDNDTMPPALGKQLRDELQRRLSVLKSETASEEKIALERIFLGRTKGVPIAIQLMFDFIDKEVGVKRRGKTTAPQEQMTYDQSLALKKRRTFFNDQECFFTFPVDPSPFPLLEYHFIEGHSIFMLDLELLLSSSPRPNGSLNLSCVQEKCRGHLERQRSNWSKRKTLFPVLEQNGVYSFGSVMTYCCTSCGHTSE
ncbi:MAG: hypothetical protein JZU67_01270, partial [Burkholderiaceae bacterium]|nr:hypothetical protein [Burkholderiaceae bacterium]